MLHMQRFFIPLLIPLLILIAVQESAARQTISGRVLDGTSGQPMEYVNVVLFDTRDSIVTGTVTNAEGVYELPNIAQGDYYAELRFMGYETETVRSIAVRDAPVRIDAVLLQPTTIGLGEVVAEGGRSTITYQIDKKVISVDQMATVISGTAADVLSGIPSVTVDIEGNVSLRGSGNFTVLIDGKPSILDAQDALQQIPASSIENIEIITNPSAKYDPEGTAGIINITMKKQQGSGWSGMANANVGLKDKYGGDMLFEHTDGSTSALLGLDYNRRTMPGTSEGEERYDFQGTSSLIQSTGDMKMQRNNLGVRGALEFPVGARSSFAVTGRYGTREWKSSSSLLHSAWSGGVEPVVSRNHLQRQRGGTFAGLDVGYRQALGAHGHRFSADVMFRYRDSDELTISELFDAARLTGGRRTTEDGPSREVNARVEYVLPFSEATKFEAGY